MEDKDEKCASFHFHQFQKNQTIDLQDHLERYCNLLPVIGFNITNYGNYLIKSHLLPIFIFEKDFEPVVFEKAIQYLSFKFGDIQLLTVLNFLGGASSFDSLLKSYKTSYSKGFLSNGSITLTRLKTALAPCDAFCSKLRSFKPLQAEYTECQIDEKLTDGRASCRQIEIEAVIRGLKCYCAEIERHQSHRFLDSRTLYEKFNLFDCVSLYVMKRL